MSKVQLTRLAVLRVHCTVPQGQTPCSEPPCKLPPADLHPPHTWHLDSKRLLETQRPDSFFFLTKTTTGLELCSEPAAVIPGPVPPGLHGSVARLALRPASAVRPFGSRRLATTSARSPTVFFWSSQAQARSPNHAENPPYAHRTASCPRLASRSGAARTGPASSARKTAQNPCHVSALATHALLQEN